MVEQTATAAEARSRLIRGVATFVFFGVVPVVVVVAALTVWIGDGRAGFDLRHAFLPAAHEVLHGDSPYPAPDDPAVRGRHAYVYTPVVALAATPLTVLPENAAVTIGMVGSFAAVFAVLLLAGVRDWRCYTIALVWPPVLNSAGNAAISLLLAVLLAAAWRVRRREVSSGVLVGCAVAAKSFAWPLLAWPAVMRRWRSTVGAVAVAACLSLGSWAAVGFAGLREYPDLVRAVTAAQEHDSYSVSSVLLEAGAGVVVARTALVVLTTMLILLAIFLGRRGAEQQAFSALLLASLTATPLLWQHYLTLLLVAVAITRPRMSFVWLLPLVLYLSPMTGNGDPWQTVLVPAVAGIVGLACVLPARNAVRWARPTGGSLPAQ